MTTVPPAATKAVPFPLCRDERREEKIGEDWRRLGLEKRKDIDRRGGSRRREEKGGEHTRENEIGGPFTTYKVLHDAALSATAASLEPRELDADINVVQLGHVSATLNNVRAAAVDVESNNFCGVVRREPNDARIGAAVPVRRVDWRLAGARTKADARAVTAAFATGLHGVAHVEHGAGLTPQLLPGHELDVHNLGIGTNDGDFQFRGIVETVKSE